MKKFFKYCILFLIQLLEKWEYSGLELDENDAFKKIIESLPIRGIKIETDHGFKPITALHKTQPYRIWRIDLENGLWLEGADNHILFDQFMGKVFIKNLKINDLIQTKYGLSKIINKQSLYQKVSMFDVTVDSEEHRFYSNDILSHNTTTISAFFAWYLCFHTDRNLLIIANKQQTTTEIVAKVLDVFKGLPFFLKPGIRNIAALGLRLDNGCMLTSQATTKTAAIGFAIHVLYIDEFAHINQKTVRSFWRSVYPTLSSSLISQCIITSTPDGMDNLFFDIWDKANKGKNSFSYKRVDYWEVPGHDDEWANNMKADFGEEEFAQEFELSFDRRSNLLLSGSQLSWIKKIGKEYEYKELEKTELDDILYRNKLTWHPNFDPNYNFDKTFRFILSNDIAEGKDDEELKDNDYNVTSIYQVELKSLAKMRMLRKDERLIKNLFRIRQVGLFRDNIGDEEIMGKVNKALVFDQLGEEYCKLVTEMNFNGKAFLKEFSNHDDYFGDIVMNTYHTAPIPGEPMPRKKPGYKTRNDKDHFCRLGKKLLGKKIIIPSDKITESEFGSFGKVKNGWKGIAKHDDTVMACLNLSRFYEEQEYSDWLYDFLDDLPDSKEKRFAMKLIEEPYDENETSDDMFKALYLEQEDPISEVENLKEIFSQERSQGYKPSSTVPSASLPWK